VGAAGDGGVAPGLSSLILGRGEAPWDAVESFSCWVGGLPVVRHWPYEYRSVFSPIDVIAEYTRPARLVVNRHVVTRPALSEVELLDLPGVGTLEAFNTDGLRTLLRTSTVPTMKEKTMRYPGHAEMMRMLRDSGFFSEQLFDVAGVRVRPLDLTARLLSDAWQPAEGEEDITVMRVEVEGTVAGAAVRHRWDLVDHFDRGRGVSSMARTTGYTCSAAVHALASGLHNRPGLVPPENLGRNQACFDAVISYLAARGVVLRHSVEDAS
jgi:saccharopine dehydrogenase-like NADP-dependent oxidoreductase